MKKKICIVCILVIGILIIGVTILLFLKKEEKLIFEDTITLKIGEFVPTEMKYQLGKQTNQELISWSNIELEDGKIYHAGTYEGSFTLKETVYKIKLTVIDEMAPVIENVKDITINEKEEVDLLKEITVTDDSHDKVSIKVNGEYDTTKKGEYVLSYEATDQSGNTTTKEFKLIVKEVDVSNQSGGTAAKPNEVVGKTSKGYTIEKRNGVYYINNILIANKTYALPSSYGPGLLPELLSAFEQLKAGAKQDGIELTIISGFRSYSSQNSIYNNYVKNNGQAEADTFSARAGHSEHQTGLAIDLNSLMFNFGETKEGQWIQNNAYKYGFIIRYPEGKEHITGYRYEPWHLRYVGSLSEQLYNGGDWITLEEYLGITSQYQN